MLRAAASVLPAPLAQLAGTDQEEEATTMGGEGKYTILQIMKYKKFT